MSNEKKKGYRVIAECIETHNRKKLRECLDSGKFENYLEKVFKKEFFDQKEEE